MPLGSNTTSRPGLTPFRIAGALSHRSWPCSPSVTQPSTDVCSTRARRASGSASTSRAQVGAAEEVVLRGRDAPDDRQLRALPDELRESREIDVPGPERSRGAPGLQVDLASDRLPAGVPPARDEIEIRVDDDQPVGAKLGVAGRERCHAVARIRDADEEERPADPAVHRLDLRGELIEVGRVAPVEVPLGAEVVPGVAVLGVPPAEQRVSGSAGERLRVGAVDPAARGDDQAAGLGDRVDRVDRELVAARGRHGRREHKHAARKSPEAPSARSIRENGNSPS